MAGEDDQAFYVRDTIAMLRPYPQDGPWAGRLSKMRIMKAQLEEHTPKDKRPPLVGQIDEAVARILAGTYEHCSACGKRITEDRARIESPWITKCAACNARKVPQRDVT